MRRTMGFAALFAILLVLGVTALTLASGVYELTWWSIDGGGGTSAGGSYSLTGAIGQAEGGQLSGGAYELTGGFWVPFETWQRQYLPALRK